MPRRSVDAGLPDPTAHDGAPPAARAVPHGTQGASVHRLGTTDRSSSRVRVVDAALRCIARTGLAKTTVDDVAREAGLSRATLYRLFPNKDAVVGAVVETERARLFASLGAAMGEAQDLETMLVVAIAGAARRISAHQALRTLLAHEPGTILPHLAFSGLDRLLDAASRFAAPYIGRWLAPDAAARAAEWATRVTVSYMLCPDEGVDVTDEDAVAHLVRTFVLPGVQSLAMTGGAGRTRPATGGVHPRKERSR